jgi:hypothetical protein
MVLRVPKVWLLPLAVPAVMIASVASIYIGSVINPTGHPVSFTPTAVVGVGGSGLFTGVSSLASDGNHAFWGAEGELRNGVSYSNSGSGAPVQLGSEDATTTLSNVASVTGGSYGFCALVTSGNVDCWGTNEFRALGIGVYDNDGGCRSDTPVSVVDTTAGGTASTAPSATATFTKAVRPATALRRRCSEVSTAPI